MLDAGRGTGAISRRMLAICPRIELTIRDLSPAMLARTTGCPTDGEADVHQLPVADRKFDLVVSAWVVETVGDPSPAISEFLRVLDIEGALVCTFFSPPSSLLTPTNRRCTRARACASPRKSPTTPSYYATEGLGRGGPQSASQVTRR